MPDAKYGVNNVVLTVSYEDTSFDLNELASNLEGARYEPEMFPGVIYKIIEPKAAFLIFSSGKANCVGANSVKGGKKAIEKLTDKLQELGGDVGEPEVKVQNMVASVDFQRKFDLEEIARNFPYAEYNPETFPGLAFRLWKDKSLTFLLFTQGEGVCVGAKSEKEIKDGINRIEETIE